MTNAIKPGVLNNDILLESNQNNPPYSMPFFADKNRLFNIQTLFPTIDKIYQEYAQKHHIPGYAYGIMLDGELIHTGSNGYADINKKIPATSHTMFRIASMTKSFTAMAIVKLRDEGRLRLDDPIYDFFPEIRDQKLTHDQPEITIRDLLIQSSGLPQDDPWADRNLDYSDEQLIDILKQGISFSNVPGIIYEYSNLAFAMLGYIIKKTSGLTYQEFITENIWKPLGMNQAEWEFSRIPVEQLARGYRWTDTHWQEEELLHDGSFGAMGGVITSIESFSRYVALHQLAWPPRNDDDNGPIKRSSIREMHQPWRLNDLHLTPDDPLCPSISAYAYGLRWLKDCDKKIYVGHSGGLPGFGSHWFIMPDYGIGVMLFTNVTYANAAEINLQVLNTLTKEAQLQPRELPVSDILNHRYKALIELLPDWENAEKSPIFAHNFFLDTSLDSLKKQTAEIFSRIGQVHNIGKLIPENQLRGYFIVTGEKSKAKISFTLTPQNPALIQKYYIEEV